MNTIFSPSPTKELEIEFKKIIKEAKDTKRSGNSRLYSSKMQEAENIAREIALKTLVS